jgi:glycosyltransferase involved in cell wall biosynthesis
LIVAANGVDVKQFVPRDEWRSNSRGQWGVHPETFVFGAVGRLAPVKGFDVLLKLFARLAGAADRPVHLVLIGRGTEEQRLKALAQDLGLVDAVTFHPFTDVPWQAMNGFDAFVMPSKNEGLPFAMMEAMACGCVPIATRVGGIGEVLTDRTVGWLIEPGDDARFLTAMEEATQLSIDDRRQMGTAARARIVGSFNRDAQMSSIADVIER